MQYRYAQNRNFEDYASGRVFYSHPGHPAFPVRLASEIFQRALAHWKASGKRLPCKIYDPVCGSAYWLSVLAYLHWEAISAVYASDIDIDVLTTAERNLSLLTPTGLNGRLAEIKAMHTAYGKDSHADALASADKFREQLINNWDFQAIDTRVFQADALNSQSMAGGLKNAPVDLVLADVPYGWHSNWQVRNGQFGMRYSAVELMLEALSEILNPGAVVAVATDKSQKVRHEKFNRLARFQLGKRRIFMLQLQ